MRPAIFFGTNISAIQTGEKNWVNNGVGKKIGTGWNDARHVFSGGDGVIYKIDSRGDLYWTKHLGFQDGMVKWSEQKQVGNGWQNLRQVFRVVMALSMP